MFGSRRSRETNPVYVDDVRFSETSPIKFVGIRPRESKPRSKYVWLPKAKGNESYIYVCWCREAERNEPQYFFIKNPPLMQAQLSLIVVNNCFYPSQVTQKKIPAKKYATGIF